MSRASRASQGPPACAGALTDSGSAASKKARAASNTGCTRLSMPGCVPGTGRCWPMWCITRASVSKCVAMRNSSGNCADTSRCICWRLTSLTNAPIARCRCSTVPSCRARRTSPCAWAGVALRASANARLPMRASSWRSACSASTGTAATLRSR